MVEARVPNVLIAHSDMEARGGLTNRKTEQNDLERREEELKRKKPVVAPAATARLNKCDQMCEATDTVMTTHIDESTT